MADRSWRAELDACVARLRAVDAYEMLTALRAKAYGAHPAYHVKGEAEAQTRYSKALVAFEAISTPVQAALLARDLDSVDADYPPG